MEMAGGMDSMTRLILTQPMTVFAFPDTLFSVHVALVDAMDAGNTGRAGQPLEVQLMHGDGKTVFSAANNLLSIENPPVLSNRGLCELKCKIAEDYRGTGNLGGGLRCFQLRISVAGRPDVEPLLTDGVTIIRYCLQVRENPAKPVPKEWFKDEGGRENCVEMQVHLIDREGVEVTNRRVPLRLVLLYNNLSRVQNQEILKLSPDSKLSVDEEGKATLRVRIEEVSKNHQKQAFRIKVEPDTIENPDAVDVSSVVSMPITVYSKRIKRKGKGAVAAAAAAAAAAAGGAGSAGAAGAAGYEAPRSRAAAAAAAAGSAGMTASMLSDKGRAGAAGYVPEPPGYMPQQMVSHTYFLKSMFSFSRLLYWHCVAASQSNGEIHRSCYTQCTCCLCL
jgi:hypothetical protein